MPGAQRFEDLKVWQEARELVRQIYTITSENGFRRDFSLRDQIRRAAVSTMSNIAEGFERGGRKEFIQFLYIAKGSSGEVRSQLCVALDQKFIDDSTYEKLSDSTVVLSKRISKFIQYLAQYPSGSRARNTLVSSQP